MSNAAVVFRNLADDATVTAQTALLAAPASAVQDPDVGYKWRSLSSSDALIIDLGSATALDTIAVMGLAATTVRVKVSATDATGALGELYDSTSTPVNQDHLQAVFCLGATVNGRYVRIELTHSTLAYVEAGRAVVGARSTFDYNFDYGAARGYADPSPRALTEGGQTQVRRKQSARTVSVSFGWLSQSDRDGFVEDMLRENGLKDDVLFIYDPAATDLAVVTYWGLMDALAPTVESFPDIHSTTIAITERL